VKFIKFASNKAYKNVGEPVPMKRVLPEWYKKAESTYPDKDGNDMPGLKTCMPYTDMMMAGYALVIPVDISVSKKDNGELSIEWDRESPAGHFISERPKELGATMPRPYGFAPNHLVFSGRWGWKTPKGWSTIVTHPFNRVDLPFHTISAFMDSDEFHGAGNIPFFIREDFEGIIKAGTPFAQVIPVKRAVWKMVNDPSIIDQVEKHVNIVRNDSTPYKKVMWHRKKYD
jgi:hypothetical protein